MDLEVRRLCGGGRHDLSDTDSSSSPNPSITATSAGRKQAHDSDSSNSDSITRDDTVPAGDQVGFEVIDAIVED
jgi:hypothetical protein